VRDAETAREVAELRQLLHELQVENEALLQRSLQEEVGLLIVWAAS
jgi:hypothetical protein